MSSSDGLTGLQESPSSAGLNPLLGTRCRAREDCHSTSTLGAYFLGTYQVWKGKSRIWLREEDLTGRKHRVPQPS